MPGEVGADLETMRQLCRGLDDNAQRVVDLKSALDGCVSSTVWKGVNADRFRAAWEEFKPSFDRLYGALSEGRDDVRAQHNALAAATGEPASI